MNNNFENYIYNSNYFTIKNYKKGSILFNEGDICKNI